MKVAKALLGMLFAAWAVSVVVLGIRESEAPIFTAEGLWDLAVFVTPVAMLTVFSIWSFQSALGTPKPPQEHAPAEDADKNQQPEDAETPHDEE